MKTQWIPIETAPKDGTVIDVWCVTEDSSAAVFYFGATKSGVKDRHAWQGRVSEVWWKHGAWRPKCGLQLQPLVEVTPTHWMPLPKSPQGKELTDV